MKKNVFIPVLDSLVHTQVHVLNLIYWPVVLFSGNRARVQIHAKCMTSILGAWTPSKQ